MMPMKNQDEINLINFFTRNKSLTRAQRARFASLVARDIGGFEPSDISNNNMGNLQEFETERTKFNPLKTAEFLSLFGAPSGLKFLTHDFDPNSDMSMPRLLKQVNKIIKEWQYKIPDSLCSLMTSFVQRGGWIDFKGKEHELFLEGDDVTKWCLENPKLNPVISNEFGPQIQDFRNTVRLQLKLEESLNDVIESNNNLAKLNIKTDKLNRADFYTNVLILRKILRAILLDIAQRNQQANIKIEFVREIYNNSYRTCIIRITHIDSIASDFEEVKKKLYSKGGALYNIFISCIGYCDWSIEATFEDVPKRWNIINHTQQDEFQEIDTPDGFTHILIFL